MILVDIFAPEVNQNYDFNLNENIKISVVLEEISGMICQKEQKTISGNVKDLLLISQNRRMVLNSELTLAHYNIAPGDRLIIV